MHHSYLEDPEFVDCVWIEKHKGIPRYLMYRLMQDCPEIESVAFPRPNKSRFTRLVRLATVLSYIEKNTTIGGPDYKRLVVSRRRRKVKTEDDIVA